MDISDLFPIHPALKRELQIEQLQAIADNYGLPITPKEAEDFFRQITSTVDKAFDIPKPHP